MFKLIVKIEFKKQKYNKKYISVIVKWILCNYAVLIPAISGNSPPPPLRPQNPKFPPSRKSLKTHNKN